MIRSFDSYLQDWWDYTLEIDTDRGPIKIHWSNANNLARWSNMQAGLYLQDTNSLQTFYENFPNWYQKFWNSRFDQGLFDLADNSIIMDIGCGVSVIDLLLSKYLPNSKFYLLDKEGFSFQPNVYYDYNYPEYHSWDPVVDAINTTKLDPRRFRMISPKDEWPKKVDVITSYFSYCWHYPKEVYWKQVLRTLKIGGKLILDIRHLIDRDIVKEITEDMKSEPVVSYFDTKLPAHIDNMPAPKKGEPLGGRYCWTRKD